MTPALTLPGLDVPQARVRERRPDSGGRTSGDLLTRLLGERAVARVPAVAPVAPAVSAASAPATLDDLLCGAWSALEIGEATACPSCGSAMHVEPAVRGGRCGGCAASLT